MEAYETFKHKGLTVELIWDNDGDGSGDPRDADNIGCMYCWHPDYELGDEQFGRRGDDSPDFKSMAHVERYLTLIRHAVVVMPLYLLDHSGLSMTVGAPSWADNPRIRTDHHGNGLGWDTTHVGYIYTTAERITELCGNPQLDTDPYYCPRTWPLHEDGSDPNWTGTAKEWIVKQLESEVKYYDAYLQGSVLGWRVKDHEGNELDACWGYLVADDKDEEYVRDEARMSADGYAEDRDTADPWNAYCDAEQVAFEAAAKRLSQFSRAQLAEIREHAEEACSDIEAVCSMMLGDKEVPEGWAVERAHEEAAA